MSNPPPAPPAPWSPPLGWQPPPPPAPAGRRSWIWVLVASLLAIVVLAGVTFGIWLAKMKPPLDAANDYMRALSRHDYRSALAQLCPADRADASEFALRRDIETGDSLLRNLDDWSITPFDVNRDGSHASVEVDVRPFNDDQADIFTLLLDEIDGEWQPCGGIFGFEAERSSPEVAGARIGVGRVGEHVDE